MASKKSSKKKSSSKRSSDKYLDLTSDQEEFMETFTKKESEAILDALDIEIDDVKKFSEDTDYGVTVYRIEGPGKYGSEWTGFADDDDATIYAENYVKQMLDDEPELFNESFISQYLTITDTDRRIIAQEEADNLVDDNYDDDHILEQAGVKEDYEMAEEEAEPPMP